MSAADCCGREIAVGDYLAYATRLGSGTFLKLARVTGLHDDGSVSATAAERDWTGGWRRQARSIRLRSLALSCRVVDLPEEVQAVLQ